MDEILKRLIYPYSSDQELRERIAAVYAIADAVANGYTSEYWWFQIN